MIHELSDLEERARVAGLLARSRREHAVDDGADPHSSVEGLPTAAELAAALRDADRALLTFSAGADPSGYGLTWSWQEEDGTEVHLLDVWAVPGPEQQLLEAELFEQLEADVRARVPTAPSVVLGANCRSTQPARLSLLLRRGFTVVFDMVDMQAPAGPLPRSGLPPGITLRCVTPDDAANIVELTARAWAGRAFFSMPSLDDVRGWLTRADPELYLLAVHGATVVGLASATLRPQCAEIDDVQVDRGWQRRGLASALLGELSSRLATRTSLPVRLHTEGHDPAGARTLYEHLGFTTTATYHRLRKPL